MSFIVVTMKSLGIDIKNEFKITPRMSFVSDFEIISTRFNLEAHQGKSDRLKFIIEDEKNYSSYALYKLNASKSLEPEKLKEEVFNFQKILAEIHNALWLVKDYGVTIKEGISWVDYDAAFLDIISLTFYNSDCLLSNNLNHNKITAGDILKGNEYKKIIDTLGNTDNLLRPTKKFYKKLKRSISYIPEVRKTNNKIHRISFLIIMLECLLGDDKEEISFKVSMKVSYLSYKMGIDKDINNVYSKIKKAYTYRSKYFHGSEINESDDENITETLKYLENTIKEIIIEFLKSVDEQDDQWIELFKDNQTILDSIVSSMKYIDL